MINNGIRDYNSRISNIQNYDMIITVPSQAPLNQMIINEFKSYINPNKTLMIDDFLLKNRVKDIRWDNEEYKEVEEREGKNPEQFIDLIEQTKLPARVMTNANGAKKFEASFKKMGVTDYKDRHVLVSSLQNSPLW